MKSRTLLLFYLRSFSVLNLFFIVSLCGRFMGDWVNFRPEELVEILFWFHWLPFPEGEWGLALFAILINTLVLVKFEKQSLRIIAFVVSLIFYGRCVNPNAINHNWYFILFPLFFTTLFPSKSSREILATSVRFCLTSVFLPFTLSGLVKVWYGMYALFTGQLGAFNDPWAFHKLIAQEVPVLRSLPLGVQWTLNHPVLTYLLYLLAILLEVVSSFVAWSEKYLVLIGISFVIFQLGTKVFMNILFEQATLVLLTAVFLYPKRVTTDTDPI